MTTERRFGAQSMTAPLLDVLVKRPGPAFGARVRRPGARLPPPGRPRPRAARARRLRRGARLARPARPRARRRDSTTPDLVYTFDPLLVTDRGAIPLRPGKPNRAPEPAAHRGLDDRGRHPDARPDRGARDDRGRRHVLAAAGPVLHRADAADQRRRASPSWPALVGGDVRVFDVPYWRGPAELIHLMSVISPVADDLAVVYLPLLPVGLWELLVRPRHPPGRGPGRGVPDARLQRAGGPARAWSSWPRATRGRPRPWPPPAARSTPTRPTEIGDQRLGRADLHDPADPAWLTRGGAGHRSRPADRGPAGARPDPEHHRVRGGGRGVGGRRPRATSGWRVEVDRAGPGRHPGRPRLAGRGDAADGAAGRHRARRARRRAAASSCRAISMSCRPATRRPGRPIRGPARSATARCTAAAPAT